MPPARCRSSTRPRSRRRAIRHARRTSPCSCSRSPDRHRGGSTVGCPATAGLRTMAAMPRSSRRLEPRHLDPERLRLTAPSRPASMAAVGVALVLAVLGVAVFSGGAVGRGSAALKSDPAAAEAPDPSAPDTSDPTTGASDPGGAAGRYRVVEAHRIEPAPEPGAGSASPSAPNGRAPIRRPSPTSGSRCSTSSAASHTAGGKGGLRLGHQPGPTLATQMLLSAGARASSGSPRSRTTSSVCSSTTHRRTTSTRASRSRQRRGAGVARLGHRRLGARRDPGSSTIPFSGQVRPPAGREARQRRLGRGDLGHERPQLPAGDGGRARPRGGRRDRQDQRAGGRRHPDDRDGRLQREAGDPLPDHRVTALESAIGGGSCYPPPQPMRVDWIFASPSFTFGTYEVTRAAPVPYITDHAALFSRLSLG